MDMPRHFRRFRLRVQCFPLQSVLLALGNPPVDYFSLDIEGAEFPVLNTIPFDKVRGGTKERRKMKIIPNIKLCL